MNFTVRDWMNDLVVYVNPDSTVADALALMRRRYIHSLIVSKTPESPHFGILTSTDISDKIIAQEKNPTKVTVGEIMTAPLLTVAQGASLKDCSVLMKEHRIHHLPVINEKEQIVGMISATDFLVAAEAMGRAPGERIV
jgi:CBS domain-containing protein